MTVADRLQADVLAFEQEHGIEALVLILDAFIASRLHAHGIACPEDEEDDDPEVWASVH